LLETGLAGLVGRLRPADRGVSVTVTPATEVIQDRGIDGGDRPGSGVRRGRRLRGLIQLVGIIPASETNVSSSRAGPVAVVGWGTVRVHWPLMSPAYFNARLLAVDRRAHRLRYSGWHTVAQCKGPCYVYMETSLAIAALGLR